MDKLVQTLVRVGLSEKAARVYLAALTLGEATVAELGRTSGVPRTSIYYTLKELEELGALIKTKRTKRVFYIPDEPKALLKRLRDRVFEAEDLAHEFEGLKHASRKLPRVYFLYGPAGFKQIWDMVLTKEREMYRIVTESENFLDFVREKYIIDDIIRTKRGLGITSRQLIVDSPYARQIVAKDAREGRVSRFLPKGRHLPFTEIITEEFVAFISPRLENTLLVVESEQFAATRTALFETLWDTLPIIR